MKYLLIMQVNPAVLDALTEEERNEIGSGHGDFMKAIQDSGEFILTQALADPANSKVVRGTGGAPAVTDGPYGEVKELLAGLFQIDVESLDRAVEIAGPLSEYGWVEIRPVMEDAGDGDVTG